MVFPVPSTFGVSMHGFRIPIFERRAEFLVAIGLFGLFFMAIQPTPPPGPRTRYPPPPEIRPYDQGL